MSGRIGDPGRFFSCLSKMADISTGKNHMNPDTIPDVGPDPEKIALFRARKVFESVVERVLLAAEGGDASAPKAVLAKLGDLQRAYLDAKKAEEVFNDKYGLTQTGDIDFADLRHKIGGRLDSLRAARGAG